MRGADHYHSEFPFTIDDDGIHILTLSSSKLTHASTMERTSSGNADLDRMAGGGLFQDSIVLVSGPTGGGKTLMCAMFAAEACRQRERVLLIGYEESRDQILRNAESWGVNFESYENDEVLRINSQYPEGQNIESHLLSIRQQIDDFRPTRLVIDSVSAMERIADVRSFREFVIGLTAYVKEKQICTLLTCTTPQLSGGESVTEAHISTITDAIILLRYIEISGSLSRGILIIKMRGSQHEKDIREFSIDDKGLHIGDTFDGLPNVLSGIPSASRPAAATGS